MGCVPKTLLLYSAFLRAISLSSIIPMPRHICLGTIWQILAKEQRLNVSLSSPVGEAVFVMYKEIHEEETAFATEVFFHLNMVKTCQFHTQTTLLPMCTKPFTGNEPQTLYCIISPHQICCAGSPSHPCLASFSPT